jgi:hypothetical protein
LPEAPLPDAPLPDVFSPDAPLLDAPLLDAPLPVAPALFAELTPVPAKFEPLAIPLAPFEDAELLAEHEAPAGHGTAAVATGGQ